jgi:hypothetical protein
MVTMTSSTTARPALKSVSPPRVICPMFSRRSMEEHWQGGYHDTIRTLRYPEVLERPRNRAGLFIFDIDGRE